MTCITLALTDRVDDGIRSRLGESAIIKDYLLDQVGVNFLLAVTEYKVGFEGVNPLQIEFEERISEDFIALISEGNFDFSFFAYKIYADPFNTPSLVVDNRIGDGFIIKAGQIFDSPEGNLKVLRTIKAGAKVDAIYRRSGEPSAVMDNRILIARCGPYHPKTDEILKPFKGRGKDTVKLHVLSFNIRDHRITVDNTFKPKTVKVNPAFKLD